MGCHAVTHILMHLGLVVLTQRVVRPHTGAVFIRAHQSQSKDTNDGVGRGVKGDQWVGDAAVVDFVIVECGEPLSH